MQATIQYIRNELNEIYPNEEIEGFIKLIFSHIKNYTLTDIVLKKEEPLQADELRAIEEIVGRLKKYEPIQYIIGTTEFQGLTLKVNHSVLIPRSETEELIEWITSTENNPKKILDIGTGSGCIALSLKKAFPGAKVWGYDISEGAIAVAIENSISNHIKVNFLKADILNWKSEQISEKYDLVVSNPPYVTQKERFVMQQNVTRYEPHLALFVPDADPLLYYSAIADFCLVGLIPGGNLYVEINENFGDQVVELFHFKGFTDILLKKDLQGKNRMVKATKR